MELVNDGTDDCPYGDDENHHDDDGDMEFIMMYFNYSDADGDGVLSADEFTTFYNNINDGPSIEFLFSLMDYDGDGMVTASEYSDYANETTGVSEPMSEEDWNDFVAMFSYMDTNSDGGMDLEELSAMMGSMDDDDDDDDGPTFICGDGTEILFDYVNDGEDDCDDGADEQQYDTDGDEINWFDCMDGSQVWISQVNDGTEDCPDGDDEAPDDDHGDHGDDGHDDHGDDGMLSEEDMFEMGDLNGDGFVNMSEMEHLFSEDHDDHDDDEEPPTPEEAMENDTDNSGGISWSEFYDAWEASNAEDVADGEDNMSMVDSSPLQT